MNPLYQSLTGQQIATSAPFSSGNRFQDPIQRMQYIMQAMQNPAAFVRQAIPDIPHEISNDPNQILTYLQRTRGISNEQIQQIASSMAGFRR